MLCFGSFLLPQDSVVHSGQEVLRQQIPLVLDSGQGVGGELGGVRCGEGITVAQEVVTLSALAGD